MRSMKPTVSILALALLMSFAAACGKKRPPVAAAPAPPPAAAPAPAPPPPPPQRVEERLPVPQEPRLADDEIGGRSLDDLNRDSPFKPVFFGLDESDLDEEAQKVAQQNAQIMKKYSTWIITIEGHCDERGTAEYNLALGERRATAVKTYMTSLGISPDRMRIVSYGKEFPFDPAHTDAAWAKNRRAHFVITSK